MNGSLKDWLKLSPLYGEAGKTTRTPKAKHSQLTTKKEEVPPSPAKASAKEQRGQVAGRRAGLGEPGKLSLGADKETKTAMDSTAVWVMGPAWPGWPMVYLRRWALT
ncbi:hypothetical protein KIL84_021258 [Mauremys mutica]|uniref:Uncharacterized protein n=1 Tax=Mauremys mutica TaxID=74926 RepID=A0A9D3X9R4_9SAUR|nr:hypothetical protein KIL84_021258 [Mauremys mutica]